MLPKYRGIYMGKNERQSYLAAIKKRYRQARKGAKKLILDEFCQVCGYHRKYAIRLLNKKKAKPGRKKKLRKPGPKPRYQHEELVNVLKTIWFVADQPCSKRFVPLIKLWLPFYEDNYGLLTADIKDKLQTISAATIDRLLQPVRAHQQTKGITATKPGTLLRNQIPIRTDAWDISEPGFMEADTVAHCGNSLMGDFAWSLTLTDYCTGWTENRATWGKGAGGVVEQIKDIEQSLPFELKGFDCDNGSEFLNYHLLRYFQERDAPVAFTRSRPYKKNDNAHVEQKNWTHVRQLFGYDRIDKQASIALMNDLYKNEWSALQNFFLPNMKLKTKTRINSRYKRTYYSPETPYQRLLQSEAITKQQKQMLINENKSLDPFKLRATIEEKLTTIFKLISVTSNVRLRL